MVIWCWVGVSNVGDDSGGGGVGVVVISKKQM